MKQAQRIISALTLGVGVLVLIVMTTVLYLLFVIPTMIAVARGKHLGYVAEVWVGFDKQWNAICMGDHRETFSSRIGKIVKHNAPTSMPKWFTYGVYYMLEEVEHHHCIKSIDWGHGAEKPNEEA